MKGEMASKLKVRRQSGQKKDSGIRLDQGKEHKGKKHCCEDQEKEMEWEKGHIIISPEEEVSPW